MINSNATIFTIYKIKKNIYLNIHKKILNASEFTGNNFRKIKQFLNKYPKLLENVYTKENIWGLSYVG